MATLRKSQILNAYNAAQTRLLAESQEQHWAARKLVEFAQAFNFSERYDIFLSHSYSDARVVKQIHDSLKGAGYKVYVDWLIDEHLDRGKVSASTAQVIKNRMNNCGSLVYLTSNAAQKSAWMPWELGYMDARTGRVAVAPVLEDDEPEFEGREYLGLYPYLDLTQGSFYIHSSPRAWVSFRGWMQGEAPTVR